MKRIRVRTEPGSEFDAVAVVAVPEAALERPDLIRTFTVTQAAAGKHQLHTLCQIAVVEEEERDLRITEVTQGTPLVVTPDFGEALTLASGAALLLDAGGGVHLLLHAPLRPRVMVKAAHRFCTRFIRLDVR